MSYHLVGSPTTATENAPRRPGATRRLDSAGRGARALRRRRTDAGTRAGPDRVGGRLEQTLVRPCSRPSSFPPRSFAGSAIEKPKHSEGAEMTPLTWRAGSVFLVAAILLAACGGGGTSPSGEETDGASAPP